MAATLENGYRNTHHLTYHLTDLETTEGIDPVGNGCFEEMFCGYSMRPHHAQNKSYWVQDWA